MKEDIFPHIAQNQDSPTPKRGRGVFQFILAYVIVFFGLVLISIAFFFPPSAEIHPSVLTAFGEILTFAGSIIGVDYHYRYKE